MRPHSTRRRHHIAASEPPALPRSEPRANPQSRAAHSTQMILVRIKIANHRALNTEITRGWSRAVEETQKTRRRCVAGARAGRKAQKNGEEAIRPLLRADRKS